MKFLISIALLVVLVTTKSSTPPDRTIEKVAPLNFAETMNSLKNSIALLDSESAKLLKDQFMQLFAEKDQPTGSVLEKSSQQQKSPPSLASPDAVPAKSRRERRQKRPQDQKQQTQQLRGNAAPAPQITVGQKQQETPQQQKKKKNRPTITASSASETRPLFVSPSNGTDILTHPIAVIKCFNQTQCIQPNLQLVKSYDAYLCKHIGQGVRFYFLAKEGLLLHPNIRLVSTPQQAQVVVYLPVSSPWEKTECSKPEFKEKTIILDEGSTITKPLCDYPNLFERPGPKEWLLYLKRSYVRRHNGEFKGYMGYLDNPNILPMTYPVADAYVRKEFNMMKGRDLEIVCTLRGSNHDPTRLRIRQWVEEYAKARGVKKFVAGQVNHASRTVVSTDYLGQMFRAKLIVTSNPSDWEGDFRLMEAFASGALIFVDHMYVPRPHPLLHGKHIVYYDNNNKTDLFEQLDYYRTELETSRRIAVAGYLHAMKYHRAANLMDLVFRTMETKRATIRYLQEKAKDAGLGSGSDDIIRLPVDMQPVLDHLAHYSFSSSSEKVHPYTDTAYHTRQRALEIRKLHELVLKDKEKRLQLIKKITTEPHLQLSSKTPIKP